MHPPPRTTAAYCSACAHLHCFRKRLTLTSSASVEESEISPIILSPDTPRSGYATEEPATHIGKTALTTRASNDIIVEPSHFSQARNNRVTKHAHVTVEGEGEIPGRTMKPEW